MVARPHFQRLVDRVRNLPPLRAAVVYPCDSDSLQIALSGQFAGYLAPVLVGPEKRIGDAAAQAGLDISRIDFIDTPDEPFAAAQRAVAMARNGEVRALIKGSLYPDDLMRAVAAPESGLRGERRLTHAFFIDVPGYPRAFVLSDAVLNIAPTLAAKRDIVQNAIHFAHALGITAPQVAVLSAVEGVTPALPATADAAALSKMAAQGMITGGVVDGPLTADSAISLASARANGIESKVAGNADVLIVPGLEAGALLLRAITAMFGALAAGVTLGATVPIVLSSRGESMEVRMASCVLASLVAAHAPRTEAATAAEKPQQSAAPAVVGVAA
ncbi:MAG TPA: bifunctional enoyl-CoA hydratase/phosphate acetyltransferase [Casimicrobiaceae bacterium]|nr:bifunctional enoyl-CoA hydratase/phosphate acetyltransferase [Casimicrobiaceae bacterium]